MLSWSINSNADQFIDMDPPQKFPDEIKNEVVYVARGGTDDFILPPIIGHPKSGRIFVLNSDLQIKKVATRQPWKAKTYKFDDIMQTHFLNLEPIRTKLLPKSPKQRKEGK